MFKLMEKKIIAIFCFRWNWRQRIRITMSGHHKNDDPIELHDQQLQYLEHRYIEHVNENESCRRPPSGKCNMPRVLPVRALNEVFMGESLSSRYIHCNHLKSALSI